MSTNLNSNFGANTKQTTLLAYILVVINL